MLSIIRPRGDIKSNWENNNPILNFREWGVEWETTVGVGEIKIKIGDGITPWNNLEYALINNITKKIVGSFASVAGENPELTEGSSIDVLWAVTKKKFDYFKNKIDAINTMIGVFSNITINTGGNTHEAVSTITDAIKKLNSGKLTTADIYDGIDSTNLKLALSANRGRLLNEAINSLSGNLSQDGNVTRYSTAQLAMDGVYSWIINSPDSTMVSKLINCAYSYDTISGELNGGIFLLIGFRSGGYAHITAHSYWNNRAISVAIIENGVWTKRFDKILTNTDLTERFKPIRIFGTEGGTFSKTLKNKVYNSVVFLAFDTSVPDNPFSFEAGYAIAFHAGLLKSENVFTLIGFDSNALHPLEIKMLDLRS